MSAFALSGPVGEATRAHGRLEDQIEAVREQLDEHDDVPESLTDEVDSIAEELEAIDDELDIAQNGNVLFSLESYHAAPTEDQLFELERGWDAIPGVAERLNVLITDRMPALYRAMNEAGIRPDPGEPVEVPVPPVR